MRKYRIVNRFRFITFVTLMMLVVGFGLTSLIGFPESYASEPKKYVSVDVVSGDTLWDLAKNYGDASKDVREVVYEICRVNQMKAQDLHAGQTILIPQN